MGSRTRAGAADALISGDDGKKYWAGVNADVSGMLGGTPEMGLPFLSRVDMQGSRNFLAKLKIGTKPGQRTVDSALEGGAGIGRVTEGVLLHVAKEVDVVEPMAKFTAALQGKKGVRSIFNVGLEEWRPAEGDQYDLVWAQWCVGHLTDEELVAFLQRCQTVLRPVDGVIVLKENLSTQGADLFDDLDSSVTREDSKFQTLFKQAGLRVVRAEIQKGLHPGDPDKLYPVKMYALRPE